MAGIENKCINKKALVLMAEGAEEMETVITVDVLRRAKIDTTLASVESSSTTITCSRGVKITADATIKDALSLGPYDVIVLPGGLKGAQTLASCTTVKEILLQQNLRGGIIAAVCAAPTALKAHEIGKGKVVTSYPAFKDALEGYYKYSEDRVVVDGNLVTSRGPGTCFEFSLKIVELLVDKSTADKIKEGLLVM